MSIYGDLSKPQRELLAKLFNAVPNGRSTKSAVSIDTAVCCRIRPQLIKALRAKGLVQFQEGRFSWSGTSAWLTPAGLKLMRGLDFSHIGGSRGRRA